MDTPWRDVPSWRVRGSPTRAFEMKTILLALLLAAAGEDAGVLQKVYVLGSSINVRKEPCKEAEVLVKAPIGTECAVMGTAPAEWTKVRCGDYEGYVATSLVGPEKPSVEALKAEAKNPVLTPEHREESALRAALLAPEDVELQKLLGELFFERNFQLAAGFKKNAQTAMPTRTFSNMCGLNKVEVCIRDAAAGFLRDVKVRTETRKDLFIVALEDADNVTVYRGKYQIDPVTAWVKGEVLERSTFPAIPVLDKAIFAGVQAFESEKGDLPFGQFVLDDTSQAILSNVPNTWALLKPDNQGFLTMHVNDCLKSPYGLRFKSDIHGRWRVSRDSISMPVDSHDYWIAAITSSGKTLDLTLADVYGPGTTHETFKLPEGNKDIAYLGDTAYTFKLSRYSEEHHRCLEGGP